MGEYSMQVGIATKVAKAPPTKHTLFSPIPVIQYTHTHTHTHTHTLT